MITIIDYGMGNLKSVYNALVKIGFNCRISGEIKDIEKSDKLILPGVGAFKDAMDNLEKMNLIPIINKKVNEGCPLLGICLGMQMLFEEGYEGQPRKGLGFIEGEVKLIEPNEEVKIPHIGWNSIKYDKNCPIFQGLSEEPYMYFVHSYYINPKDKEIISAVTEYGTELPIAVHKNNIFATQFHPEKSGNEGLKVLKNFGNL